MITYKIRIFTQINGEDVRCASHEHVVDLIRSSGSLVTMTVVSQVFPNNFQHQQQVNLFSSLATFWHSSSEEMLCILKISIIFIIAATTILISHKCKTMCNIAKKNDTWWKITGAVATTS